MSVTLAPTVEGVSSVVALGSVMPIIVPNVRGQRRIGTVVLKSSIWVPVGRTCSTRGNDWDSKKGDIIRISLCTHSEYTIISSAALSHAFMLYHHRLSGKWTELHLAVTRYTSRYSHLGPLNVSQLVYYDPQAQTDHLVTQSQSLINPHACSLRLLLRASCTLRSASWPSLSSLKLLALIHILMSADCFVNLLPFPPVKFDDAECHEL